MMQQCSYHTHALSDMSQPGAYVTSVSSTLPFLSRDVDTPRTNLKVLALLLLVISHCAYQKTCTCGVDAMEHMLRNSSASVQLEVLNTLEKNDPQNRWHCVHLQEWFDYRSHVCMVKLLCCAITDNNTDGVHVHMLTLC